MTRLVANRMLKMLNGKIDNALDLVKDGLCDPIYTFIKDEPHKREKLDKNRLRIISGVSLVDNIIERILFSTLNKLEIEISNYISFKPGMGLHDDGKKVLYQWFLDRQKEYELCSTDVSAWDWSIVCWLLDMDLEYRSSLAPSEAWAKLAKARFACVKMKLFQLPEGEMYAQLIAGIQASGSYNTSSTNSHMRHMLATLVQLALGVNVDARAEGGQMGDDALERYIKGMLEVYISYGFTVKGVEKQPLDHFSFCSTKWNGNWMGEPESWKKTLFRFVQKNPADPLFSVLRQQFERDIRHHPGKEDLLRRVDSFFSMFS